jgi:hypothetical protein
VNGVPHSEQNFAVSAFSKPQERHALMRQVYERVSTSTRT